MADGTTAARVGRALDLGFPIIPVIEDREPHGSQVPKRLEYVEALRWSAGQEVPAALVEVIFVALGVTERERRVFVSYRQADATPIAVQLYHALLERRFLVFLDRFQTAVAENIQERIDEALEDMAFVLLLYSPDTPNSVWVNWEITRALKSQLPILVIKWTNATTEIPKIKERSLPMIEFDPGRDVVGNGLKPDKLQEILVEIERLHSNGLLRRRQESLAAVRLFAEDRGWAVAEEPRWKLILTRHPTGRNPVVLGVTPRLARTEDLYELDAWQTPDLGIVGIKWNKVLVQASTDLPAHRAKMLEWVIGTRNLQVALGTNRLSLVM
jgi:hypothetical protein